MALKDLVGSRHQLNESAIENLVKDHIRYDPEKNEIVLTPAATSLQNKQKILVYLVALEGWAYVKPELEGTAAKPAELERELGIAGGTLRPMLRDLAKRRFVKSEGGAYRIIPGNLSAIVTELEHKDREAAPRARRSRKAPSRRASTAPEPQTARTMVKHPAPRTRRAATVGGSAASMFNDWIGAGFFKKPKTMKEMLEEFHNKGVIMKMTTLSKLPLQAVRSGALVRRKAEQNGKQIWLYSSED